MRQQFVSCFALALLSAASVIAQTRQLDLPVNLTAFAVSTGGIRTAPVATAIDITIKRWSTSAETQRLQKVLTEKGQDRLLDALQDVKSVGTIRTPNNLAYDLRFAAIEPGEDGGTRIFLATDRPVSYWEAVNRPRVSDYPFTFIELRLDKNGEGVGKLNLATKINLSKDGKMIELENFDSQPISLNEVHRRSK
jgi:hypothetical protein